MRDAIERGWDERTVTVDRHKLLDTLRSNRGKHKRAYEEALVGYREVGMKQLQKYVEKAKKELGQNEKIIALKIEQFDPKHPPSNQVVVISHVAFQLEVPKDHTKSYDVAIQMAEWEVGDTIELTQSQFQCFVMDDWEWKQEFETVTASYSGAAR